MQFTVAAAALALAAGASAFSNSTGTAGPVYVTEVVTAYTTYCPAATQVTLGSKTYTVTEATTLTISDCPCTIVKTSSTVPAASWTSAPVYSNGTTATTKASGAASGTGKLTATTSKPAAYTGAAAANAVSGAAVAAFGLAALML